MDFDHRHRQTLLFDRDRGRWWWYNFGPLGTAGAADICDFAAVLGVYGICGVRGGAGIATCLVVAQHAREPGHLAGEPLAGHGAVVEPF